MSYVEIYPPKIMENESNGKENAERNGSWFDTGVIYGGGNLAPPMIPQWCNHSGIGCRRLCKTASIHSNAQEWFPFGWYAIVSHKNLERTQEELRNYGLLAIVCKELHEIGC